MHYELPWPPSLNHYWRHVIVKGRVRVLISEQGRLYREDVGLRLLGKPKAPSGRLCVEVDLYPPDRRVRDIDNTQKALLDAITHAGIWPDDSVIDKLVVTRLVVVPKGKVDLWVRSREAGP